MATQIIERPAEDIFELQPSGKETQLEPIKTTTLESLREAGLYDVADILEDIIEHRLAVEEAITAIQRHQKSMDPVAAHHYGEEINALRNPKSVQKGDFFQKTTTLPSVQIHLAEGSFRPVLVLESIIKTSDSPLSRTTNDRERLELHPSGSFEFKAEATKGNRVVGFRIPITELAAGTIKAPQAWARLGKQDKIPEIVPPEYQGDKYWLTVSKDSPALSEETVPPAELIEAQKDRHLPHLLPFIETQTIETTLRTILTEFRNRYRRAIKYGQNPTDLRHRAAARAMIDSAEEPIDTSHITS